MKPAGGRGREPTTTRDPLAAALAKRSTEVDTVRGLGRPGARNKSGPPRGEPGDNPLDAAFASTMAAPAPAALEEEWYVSIDGEQAGPYALADAQQWVVQQPSDAELHCWSEGFDDWLPVDKISHFRGLRKRAAPPPLPRAVGSPKTLTEDTPKPLFTATMAALERGAPVLPSSGIGLPPAAPGMRATPPQGASPAPGTPVPRGTQAGWTPNGAPAARGAPPASGSSEARGEPGGGAELKPAVGPRAGGVDATSGAPERPGAGARPGPAIGTRPGAPADARPGRPPGAPGARSSEKPGTLVDAGAGAPARQDSSWGEEEETVAATTGARSEALAEIRGGRPGAVPTPGRDARAGGRRDGGDAWSHASVDVNVDAWSDDSADPWADAANDGPAGATLGPPRAAAKPGPRVQARPDGRPPGRLDNPFEASEGGDLETQLEAMPFDDAPVEPVRLAPPAPASSDFGSDEDLDIGEVSRVVSRNDIARGARPDRPSTPRPAAAPPAGRPGGMPRPRTTGGMPSVRPGSDSDPSALAPVRRAHRRGLIVLLVVAAVVVIGAIAAVAVFMTRHDDAPASSLGPVQDIDTSRPDDPVAHPPVVPATPEPATPATPTAPAPAPPAPRTAPRPHAPASGGTQGAEAAPGGNLAGDEIEDMARKHQEMTQRCYMRSQRGADSILIGDVKKIAVTLTIDRDGNVSDLQLSDHAADNLGRCLAGAIKAWKFRPSAGGTFRFSLNFLNG